MTQRGPFDTAERRWAGLGPYYAMFPLSFAEEVVRQYTRPGELIIDPFAGRGTSLFAAGLHGRQALGIEINPVGWIYAKTKLSPARQTTVQGRLKEIACASTQLPNARLDDLPVFFRWCYCDSVLRFLIVARAALSWKESNVDRTLMAIILQDLHGNRGRALSNQMRQAKALAPDYSVKWWRERRMFPPKIDPLLHLQKKIVWRFRHGTPRMQGCNIWLGDSTHRLAQAHRQRLKANLLFTSPPYIGIADYHYDQWIRLWMLNGKALPFHANDRTNRGDFANESKYRSMLETVFDNSRSLLAKNATVYVRTDAREATQSVTIEVLRTVFGSVRIQRRQRPFAKRTQTSLFGDAAPKPGEIDLVFAT